MGRVPGVRTGRDATRIENYGLLRHTKHSPGIGPMDNHKQPKIWGRRIPRRLLGSALTLAIILVLAVIATSSAHAQTYSVLYSFAGGIDGRNPVAGLVRDATGNLYGTTNVGGAHGYGTIFKIDSTGKETVLYSFTDMKGDGAYPCAGLLLDAKGKLYGTTLNGGAYGYGTVFVIDAAGVLSVLYSFNGAAGDGGFPYAGVVRDAKGNLYGTTLQGGAYDYGTVFKLDPTGQETVLYSFTGTGGDGANPYAGLARDAKGNLYGTTYYGGLESCNNIGCGVVFKLDKTGKESLLHTFTGTGGDGANPSGGLVRDTKGNLYGTTRFSAGGGIVFKVDATGKETLLYSFSGLTDGSEPFNENLVRDGRGNLYGTTLLGGDLTCSLGYGCGTVFQVDTTGKETVLYNFTDAGGDGENPMAGLVRDKKGNLYGTTAYGGAYGYGTVFKLKP